MNIFYDKGTQKLLKLKEFMQKGEISEYNGNKKEYASLSKSFLRQLLNDITLVLQYDGISVTNSKISFNPGGPAVAGDPSLYFVTNCPENYRGIAVYISDSSRNSGLCILYRAIKSMKDYRGNSNHWLNLRDEYSDIVENICRELSENAYANAANF